MDTPRTSTATTTTGPSTPVPPTGPETGSTRTVRATDAVLGVGRVQVTLRWDNAADLDLQVTEPNGTVIAWFNPGPTPSGGLLDFDDNRGCGTPGAVEHVYWPHGTAPLAGRYTASVATENPCGVQSPAWHLVVKVDDAIVVDRTGAGTGAPIEFWVPSWDELVSRAHEASSPTHFGVKPPLT